MHHLKNIPAIIQHFDHFFKKIKLFELNENVPNSEKSIGMSASCSCGVLELIEMIILFIVFYRKMCFSFARWLGFYKIYIASIHAFQQHNEMGPVLPKVLFLVFNLLSHGK